MTQSDPCPGCGSPFPPETGPVHAYLAVSPACWACFNASMVLHYSDVTYWPAHQVLTDAYALQHSSGDDPRARRSAALHLVALFAQCQLGLPHDRIAALRKAIAAESIQYTFRPWPAATASIRHVVLDQGPRRHLESAAAFGRAVLADWRDHHAFAGDQVETIGLKSHFRTS